MSEEPPVASASTDPRRRALGRLADVLDSRFRIPGTNQTFGVDAILGIVPVGGDIVGLVASAAVVGRAVQIGARGWTLVLMLVNVALDATVGSVPVLGTVFDVVYKANNRNVRLLETHLADAEVARGHARRAVGRSLGVVALVTVVIATVLVVGAVFLLRALF